MQLNPMQLSDAATNPSLRLTTMLPTDTLATDIMSSRKPYRQPTLVVHGNIREITQSTASGTALDAFPALPAPDNRSIV